MHQKFPTTNPFRAVCSLIFFIGVVAQAGAQSTQLTYRFSDSSLPQDTFLYGDAKIVGGPNGYLSLTDNKQNQDGTFIIDALPKGTRVKTLRIDLNVIVNSNGATPADGFSINFGPNLLNETIGEDGANTGLAISFDTYHNGDGDSAPAIEIRYDGKTIDGASFRGSHGDPSTPDRPADSPLLWPLTETNTLTLENGSNEIPVSVILSEGGAVSVIWENITVLKDVAVPYLPSKGWRIGFGARCGGFHSDQWLKNIEITTSDVVQVKVTSAYGQSVITPRVGGGPQYYEAGSSITFSAPPYAYLDRNHQSIEATPENIRAYARYRARLTSVTIEGNESAVVNTTSFQKALSHDTSILLNWKLENLGAVFTGTENIDGITPTDVTISEFVDSLGTRFYGQGADSGESFQSAVYSSVGDQVGLKPIRFAAKSVVIENDPDATEHYIEFSKQSDHFYSDDVGPGVLVADDGNFTIEFWARRNPTDSAGIQTVTEISADTSLMEDPPAEDPLLCVGFGMGGGLFIEAPAGQQSPTAVPDSWTDSAWHHWAIVNDNVQDSVVFYRDGEVVLDTSPAIDFSKAGSMAVGASNKNGNSATDFFDGGLNNLRIWNELRSMTQIRESMSVASYASANPPPALELAFDHVPNESFQGVIVDVYQRRQNEYYFGGAQAPLDSDGDSFPDAIENLNGSSPQDDASLPGMVGPNRVGDPNFLRRNTVREPESSSAGVLSGTISDRSANIIIGGDIVNFGALGTSATYEFYFNAKEDSTGSSSIAGNDAYSIRLEQWNNTMRFGVTEFGVADSTFIPEIPSIYERDTHVVVVSDGAKNEIRLYIDGVCDGIISNKTFSLSGSTRLMGNGLGAVADPMADNSVMYGWNTYDTVLSEDEIKRLALLPAPGASKQEFLNVSIGKFSGGDKGEGLDLDGIFRYAVNLGTDGNDAVGKIRDAAFVSDNITGFTYNLPNQLPVWGNPNYGSSQSDQRLATVMGSIRWSSTTGSVKMENLDGGTLYKLQLLFADADLNERSFDVKLNGFPLWDKFSPGDEQGGQSNYDSTGAVLTCQFIAQSDSATITFGRDGAAGDNNPILNGLTLEEIPGTIDAMFADFEKSQEPEQGISDISIVLPDSAEGNPDFYGLVYRCLLRIPEGKAGDYTFYLSSDDGSRMSLDGSVLVDNDGRHGFIAKDGQRFLAEGDHSLEIEFFEYTGNQDIELEYEAEDVGISRQPVPAESLYLRGNDYLKQQSGWLTYGSSEGKQIGFQVLGFDTNFPDTLEPHRMAAAAFPTFSYRETEGTSDTQLSTTSHILGNTWERVFWEWDKQFQLDLKVHMAGLSAGEPLSRVSKLPFFSGALNLDAAQQTSSAPLAGGIISVFESWVKEGARQKVGTVYLTEDRRYSLSGVTSALNAFTAITPDTLLDGSYGGKVTREYEFDAIGGPGSITFEYDKTVFQALVTIGEGFDVSSIGTTNNQLTPNLPDDVTGLLIDSVGPVATENLNRKTSTSFEQPVATGGTGDPWQWDYLGKKWYPLKPGFYNLTWKDLAGESFEIEVIADFPGEQQEISNLYDPAKNDGSRLGSGPDYIATYTFADVSLTDGFPAAPEAHYNYVISPNSGDLFKADLDRDPNDNWAFQRMAFSEMTTASINQQDSTFTESTADTRSVMVFTYSPDPSVVATNGSLEPTKEEIAVRIVRSKAWEEMPAGPVPVGSRISSPLDTAGFGSGYIAYPISNYNAQIYNREAAEVGTWGPIYPVNWSGLFEGASKQLRIGFYENPHLGEPVDSFLHPDAAWPYTGATYNDIDFPEEADVGQIYIASRLGSEGVNEDNKPKKPIYIVPVDPSNETDDVAYNLYDPAVFEQLSIYHQRDRGAAGFNPNEEHAIVAPSIQSELTGDTAVALGQDAVFALQNTLNQTDRQSLDTYTSDPFTLVQYLNLVTGKWEMGIYQVKKEKQGDSPFPALDPVTHQPTDELGVPVAQPTEPSYKFDYTVFAGDVLIPPYPLNLVVGNVILRDENEGGNLVKDNSVSSVSQRTLWRDKNGNAWVISGEDQETGAGKFFYRNWYPLADDFWFFSDDDGLNEKNAGTPIAWLPVGAGANGQSSDYLDDGVGEKPEPKAVLYESYWRSDYPVLKRGETLTYQGGEYKADNPEAKGLPAVVGWASGELIYDSLTPSMVIKTSDLEQYSARLTRPLDTYTYSLSKEEVPEDLRSGMSDVQVVGSRWYYSKLPGSLQNRFYYDQLSGVLVFRGQLNGLEGGDPDLTETPITPYVLEANVMSLSDFEKLKSLQEGDEEWEDAIKDLYRQSQDPNEIGSTVPNENPVDSDTQEPQFWSGLQTPEDGENEGADGEQFEPFAFYTEKNITQPVRQGKGDVIELKSLGTGGALVPNPDLLNEPAGENRYLTLVENNHSMVDGAVGLHIIRIGDERYRGSIQVITPTNVFDEKIQLNHTGDFGGNVANMYYQWYVRDVTSLDTVKTPDDPSSAGDWQIYDQGRGLQSITFEGRPDITLSDKFFYVRYGQWEELRDVDVNNMVGGEEPMPTDDYDVDDASWRLVSPAAQSPNWSPGTSGGNVPYQWAGASNSPQLQADGSQRFLPQLVMGWVKRILDGINPYEARFSADWSGDSPATYSSMLQEFGRPYNGPVALNDEKNPIEAVGLIELYETVLQRAKDLTDQPGAATDGTNLALLLAATRLAEFYQILGMEAYSDAQSSSISIDPATNLVPDLVDANPYVFAFQNQVPTLLSEELALLRGVDFLKAYPVYNRLFWNYFKGLGEAAYNSNYQIWDVTEDGLIDENDAAGLYPMGHGDAWGHHVHSTKMHYELLRRPGFDWRARAELYSLLGNVIPTDYLDEKSFARIAAQKATVGLNVVKATYRDAYVADPQGQWQGYTDSVNPARAWGVSEWSGRVAHGAWFDWLTGNAIVPTEASAPNDPEQPAEGLDRIDREMNVADLSTLAALMNEIQQTLDGVNQGANPLGMDQDAIMFGMDPLLQNGSPPGRQTHFDQVYKLATSAVGNAQAALSFLNESGQLLRRQKQDNYSLQQKAILQDLDYRNRLINLFGTPHDGQIGPGKLYPEGYTGPDLLTYMYMPAVEVEQITPKASEGDGTPLEFITIQHNATSLSGDDLVGVTWTDWDGNDSVGEADPNSYQYRYYLEGRKAPHVVLGNKPESDTLAAQIPISHTAGYAFKAPSDWGGRRSAGKIESSLNAMLLAEAQMELSLEAYNEYLLGLSILTEQAQDKVNTLIPKIQANRLTEAITLQLLSDAQIVLQGINSAVKSTVGFISVPLDTIKESPGEGGAITTAIQGSIKSATTASAEAVEAVVKTSTNGYLIADRVLEFTKQNLKIFTSQIVAATNDQKELIGILGALSNKLGEEERIRLAIGVKIQAMAMAVSKFKVLESEGLRLQQEREALNKMIAASAQRGRYTDMTTRLSRDEQSRKYQEALNNALNYSWLAAKVYDYETSLSEGHPAAATSILGDIVRTRHLGKWVNGTPQIGNGGLAEILAKLAANHASLKGQLGLNNPQNETGRLSLRTEMLRISGGSDTESTRRWQQALAATRVENLNALPEFRRFCRPFSGADEGPQPGLVIEFETMIEPGLNVFGRPLGGSDHSYSVASFATKINSHAVWLEGYDHSSDGSVELSATPRTYLVPVGEDILQTSDGTKPIKRRWNLVNQRIPQPYAINRSDFDDLSVMPVTQSLDGSFVDRVRFSDFLAFPSISGTTPEVDSTSFSSGLLGRSVANTRWLLIIPGASLKADPHAGLDRFIDTVTDIQLQFETFSHTGM